MSPTLADLAGHEVCDELRNSASSFKTAHDLIGVYLCAIVEEEMKKPAESCPVTLQFYMALITARACDGADHELAHLMLPQIARLFREGFERAKLRQLAEEVGVELPDR